MPLISAAAASRRTYCCSALCRTRSRSRCAIRCPGRFEGNRPARLAPVHGEDVEAEAGLHELRVNPDVSSVEQRLLELGDRLAAPELAEVAALLPGRTVRQLARERFEF